MATFRARDRSSAVLRSPRSEVWAALTDADLIAKITPYVTSITVDGDRWVWRLGTIPVLGVSVAPAFTEVMELHPEERIEFTHDPARTDEMTSVEGTVRPGRPRRRRHRRQHRPADRLHPPAAGPGPAGGRAGDGRGREAHGRRLLPQPAQAPGGGVRILVLGATGYVGSRLVPHLLDLGHDVVAASSSVPDPDRFGWDARVARDPLRRDRRRRRRRRRSSDVDAVVYLVHSLHRTDFGDRDRLGAEVVAAAVAASGVRRLVYLSGLVPDVPEDELSAHIASRLEVERILLGASDGRGRAARRRRDRGRVDVVRDHPADRDAVPRAAGAHCGCTAPCSRSRSPTCCARSPTRSRTTDRAAPSTSAVPTSSPTPT